MDAGLAKRVRDTGSRCANVEVGARLTLALGFRHGLVADLYLRVGASHAVDGTTRARIARCCVPSCIYLGTKQYVRALRFQRWPHADVRRLRARPRSSVGARTRNLSGWKGAQ